MRKIADIMSADCTTISPQGSIKEAAELMKQHDIGFIPVIDGRKLIGVVTDRDLVIRGYANNHDGSTSVSEVLSDNVRTVSPDVSVDEAASIMSSGQIRRLPVVENGHLIGVVSLGDLAIREIFVNEAGEALSGISEHEGQSSSFAH
ncbi:CBS domain-containing protein [Cohnella cholangitidis]|uniref:CBS domain-containing protein n=1 Tax=Cohnella cholangitidis TaxID=2598458 RepID=A0A7G5BTK1_9BACL|nr:CBS domain-containing protein [Cohnella cholangitidis]QMV40285.1 CBS domain-containing protein [Cohnella cholangitidis]